MTLPVIATSTAFNWRGVDTGRLMQLPHDARRGFETVDVVDTGVDAGVDLALQLPLPRLGGWSWVPAAKRRVAKEQDQAGDEDGGG
jgi:hypothetical protein